MLTPVYGEVPRHAARAASEGAVQVSKKRPWTRVAEDAAGYVPGVAGSALATSGTTTPTTSAARRADTMAAARRACPMAHLHAGAFAGESPEQLHDAPFGA